MMVLITELINCLSSTLCAREKFQSGDMRHFSHHCVSPVSPSCLEMSLDDIDKTFLELRDLQQELEKLKKELSDDFSQAVSVSFPQSPVNTIVEFCKIERG